MMFRGVEAACSRRHFLSASLLLPALRSALAQNPAATAARLRFLSFGQVEPLLRAERIALPPGLAQLNPGEYARVWPEWIQDHHREILARLVRGEEDTLVNFVLFGVSFTDQPRLSPDSATLDLSNPVVQTRIAHFLRGLADPGSNRRLVLLGDLVSRLGHGISSAEQRERLAGYVSESMVRYLGEKRKYELLLSRAVAGDTPPALSGAAQVYRDRGLSMDTDFRPNFAIEQALAEVRRRNLVNSVRRVAIIGPGLDFTDKNSGLDYYPLQSLQPFAVMDALLRLGLAEARNLRLTLFDINRPALDHFSGAVQQAAAGQPYTLQLILDRAGNWDRAALDYWRSWGAGLGDNVAAMPAPPGFQNLERRALRIRPDYVRLLEPVALNAVVQHLELPAAERFDLIVATNVFVYYDRFDQALSLLNMEPMLAAGGVFLSNDLFEDFQGVRLRGTGEILVGYAPGQSDRVRIWSSPAFQPQLPPA
jgi:hypothetical protein